MAVYMQNHMVSCYPFFIIGIFPRHAIRQIEEFGNEYLMWDVCLGSYHY